MSTQYLVSKEVLPLNPLRARQQCEVTMLRKYKNTKGKRIPEIVREARIIGKKARKLNKKTTKLEKI
jgi:hypothetical protein